MSKKIRTEAVDYLFQAILQTDEIGGFARVEAFALNGVEVLHERQSAAAVEQCGIGVNHSLRRKYL